MPGSSPGMTIERGRSVLGFGLEGNLRCQHEGRLEARGGVRVTQNDQVVTGDTAIFDTKANLMTMAGGVVLTQCKNVRKGDRLLVDMTSGTSRVESDGGKVQALFMQGEGCGPSAPGAPAAPPAPTKEESLLMEIRDLLKTR